MDFASDPDEDLFQAPLIHWLREMLLGSSRIFSAEANGLFTDGSVADDHAPSRQDQFDIPQTEA